jgi:hypothetical protein
MRKSALTLCGSVMAILLVSCGGDGGSGTPTTPATPTPVPVTSFAGTWSGTYTITGCGHSGAFAEINWCGNLSYTPLPMTLTLSQSGSSVSGTLTQGSIATSVTGSVDASNHLILSGSTTLSGGILAEILGWNTTVAGSAMSGSWNTKWTTGGLAGSAQTINTLSSVTKASHGDGVVIELTRQPGGTLEDVLGALHAQ